ncbi:MAG: hypothetical protein ACKO1W_09465, partial [Microcystaceae cyanobacterium]
MAENHPLRILLRPHFRFMLANNDLARKRLVSMLRCAPVQEPSACGQRRSCA